MCGTPYLKPKALHALGVGLPLISYATLLSNPTPTLLLLQEGLQGVGVDAPPPPPIMGTSRATIYGEAPRWSGRAAASADAMWLPLVVFVLASERAASTNPISDWQGPQVSAGGSNRSDKPSGRFACAETQACWLTAALPAFRFDWPCDQRAAAGVIS
jgi:hypothetical protein